MPRVLGAAILMTLLAGCSAILDFGDSRLIDAGAAGDAGDGGGDGGDGGRDGGPDAALDATLSGPDAAVGVVCGAMSCGLPAQECCLVAGPPPTSSCIDVIGSCPGQVQRCDGPEDCSGGDVCCAQVPNSFILCRPYGTTASDCNGQLVGNTGRLVLCHHHSDCPADKPVCQDCTSPMLRFCRATLAVGCAPAGS